MTSYVRVTGIVRVGQGFCNDNTKLKEGNRQNCFNNCLTSFMDEPQVKIDASFEKLTFVDFLPVEIHFERPNKKQEQSDFFYLTMDHYFHQYDFECDK
jgi:hypothetical protein